MNSGFFSDLLTRNRGSAEVMRPRLPSLFEPPPSVLAPTDTERIEEIFEERPAHEDRENQHRAASTEPLTQASPPSARRESQPAFAPEKIVPTAQARIEQPAPALREAPATVYPARPPLTLASESAPRLQHPAQIAPVFSALPPLDPPAATAVKNRKLDREVARERAPEAIARKEAHPPYDPTPDRPRSIPTAAPQSSLIAPPVRRFEPAQLASRATPAERTVHVTIGRIEIRATTEQEPRKRERTKSPVMSLDEYLKTRTRGGAR